MTTSKDLFIEQREMEAYEQQNEAMHQAYINQLPIIDLNTLEPEHGVVKLDKDTINIKSSDMALKIITAITEGNINPLEFAVKKKLIIDALEMVMKDVEIKKFAIDKVEKYGKDGCVILGAKVSVFNKLTYKYETDATWRAIKEEMKPLEERLKAQEEKIKTATRTMASLINDDGEVLASPVQATMVQSIAVSFNKK